MLLGGLGECQVDERQLWLKKVPDGVALHSLGRATGRGAEVGLRWGLVSFSLPSGQWREQDSQVWRASTAGMMAVGQGSEGVICGTDGEEAGRSQRCRGAPAPRERSPARLSASSRCWRLTSLKPALPCGSLKSQ